jgi:hypothetical protein
MKNKVNRTVKVQRMKFQIKELKKRVRKTFMTMSDHEADCKQRIAKIEAECNDQVHVLREEKRVLEAKFDNLRLDMQEYKRKKWYQFIQR